MKKMLVVLLTALIVTGCNLAALNMRIVKSPEEFRAVAGKDKDYKLEKFTSKDSYKKVVARLTKYSRECLSKKVTRTLYNSVTTSTWTPKLKKHKNKATMILQKNISGGYQIGEKSPHKDGYYMVVVDVKKLKNNKALIYFRYNSLSHYEDFMSMFRDRLKNKGRGCPATRMYL